MTTDDIDALIDRVLELDAEAKPGPWYTDENDACWQLFAENIISEPGPSCPFPTHIGHPWQLAKCPKHSTQFAEYWPDPPESRLIAEYRTAAPQLARECQRLRERVKELEKDLRMCNCGAVDDDD